MTAPDPAVIRAALDAAEQTAKAAQDDVGTSSFDSAAEAGFSLIWSPAAVLRHIDAAKKILDSAVETLNEHEPPRCAWCLGRGTVCRDRDRALATLTALAAAWQPAQQETP